MTVEPIVGGQKIAHGLDLILIHGHPLAVLLHEETSFEVRRALIVRQRHRTVLCVATLRRLRALTVDVDFRRWTADRV